MAKKKLTNAQVKTALEQSRGLTTLAADALGVDWKTIMRYIDASPVLQDTVKVARHKRTQMAKSKLDEAIMRGESWSIMFTLKNKTDPDGEFVGEMNRHELSNPDGSLKPDMPVEQIAQRTAQLMEIAKQRKEKEWKLIYWTI